MARKRKTESEEKGRDIKIGLLTSMLIMFITALVVCISLTIILFSAMGRTVYANVLAKDMRREAESLAEETLKAINGDITQDSYRFLLRSRESSVVVLDREAKPFDLVAPRDPMEEPPERPEGDIGKGDRIDDEVALCAGFFGETTAEGSEGFTKIDQRIGVIVGVPLRSESGETLGALFILKPMSDISEASRSLLIVLAIASAIACAVMLIPIYFMTRWLTRPLKDLTRAAGELTQGNYSERAEVEGSHEMRGLGEAFNILAESLQENIGELTIERNRLNALLEGLGEGIIAFDTDCGITKYNNSAAKLLGGEVGEDPSALPGADRIKEAARKVLESGCESIDTFPVDDRVIRVSAEAIDEENGRIAGAVVLLMDMTEAERLEQTRRDYVANVSHELRTPLASIRGIADMLNDGLVKNESDRVRYYGYILKESIRLSNLINDLLELSRLQSGGVALKLGRVELYELMADVCDRTAASAAEHGMMIDLTVPEGHYYANSNPDRLEQVLVSLMDNAVKHGTEGGLVTVGMNDGGEKWEIFVENPAEIEKKDLAHIFERFYKADIAHTGEGTGLGLAIAEEVLRLMGETISVSYENGLIRFTFTAAKAQAKQK
ncbi:MAG: HAMP domain-containing protein [Clostridia bacterium]|nr:HAMP domain-containing protein [Clostridia bacterium]